MSDTPQSKGGRARSAALPRDRRAEIARLGAEARWARLAGAGQGDHAPRAVCGGAEHPLKIGDIEIPCFVLDDGRRVIHQRGMVSALGMSRGGSSRGGGDRLAHFVGQKTLEPFVSNALVEVTRSPLLFRTERGAQAYGYEATVLAEICEAIVTAADEGKLSSQQEHIGAKARLLLKAFARVGIIALVDEATGYQEFRAKNELQKILKAYITDELLPWTQKFPDEFFKEMFRVWGWAWPPADGGRRGPLGPRYAGKLIKQLIYKNLPPGILEEIEKRNPRDGKWQRRDRHAQHLTQDFGHPHVERLVAQITVLFRISKNSGHFWRLYRDAFPAQFAQLELDIIEPEELPAS